MNGFEIKVISGLEKCFVDQDISEKKALRSISMLSNERLEFQLAYSAETDKYSRGRFVTNIDVISPIKQYITLRKIEQMPVTFPLYPEMDDGNYLRTAPGLYPDLLLPFDESHNFTFVKNELRALFVTVEGADCIPAGKYPVTFRVRSGDETVAETEVEIEVIGKKLPELDLMHTEWFYTDCLADYYDCEVWSEKHWKIIDNFVKEAVRSGVNMLLTPVFTPPLDTLIGGERKTTQLVDVYLENGEYTFGYEKLDRWIDMCFSNGIKYFEICHFFTQWGAEHAPKIMAYADGEYKKIFGWETNATGAEYTHFLRSFVKDMLVYLKDKNIDKKCFFHISDEPRIEHLQNYIKAKAVVADLLEGYPIIDALSNYNFYKTGAVAHPIPSNNHIDDFLENNVPELWTYYCCSQGEKVSNRFLSMPGARIRIIGTQLYKFDIKGFLHWGFNFYNCRYSVRPINPYCELSAEFFTPAGDCFMVYPAPDGTAYTSLHCRQFCMALEDFRALKLCESLIGREKTLEIIENGIEPLTFSSYPKDGEYILDMRKRINSAIKSAE